MIVVP